MYNHQEIEKIVLEFWNKNLIFQKRMEKNRGNERFSFFDGPITANNPMGVHHAWGRTYKDVFQRFKAMQGFDQRFQNGFDCQGLWVEVEVEKEKNFKTKKDIEDFGLENFSNACRERIEKYSGIQTRQSIRLGQWMDWENSYYTHTDNNIEHIWQFMGKCKERGWLYQGTGVMPWCVRCGTSLSQHEMADSYKELTHKAVFVKFPLKGKEKEYLLVWTTTPWTLPANVAAAVNPELDYVMAQAGDEIFYLTEKTVSKLKGNAIILDHLKGKDMEGWEYEGPFSHLDAQKDVSSKVVLWDVVGEEEGTGIVHIAPGCGQEDNELGKDKILPEIAPLNEEGNFIEGFGWITGKNVLDVNPLIISDLEKRDNLYKAEDYTHRYPCCWRCGTELAFRLVGEWFIAEEEIRELMKKALEEVKFHPDFAKKLMLDWLNNMGPWCISRKRFWGLPIPVWECDDKHQTFIFSRKELEKKAVKGMDQLRELHRPWIDNVVVKCDGCGKDARRISDVGDCWMDAGIISFSTLNYLHSKSEWREWFPAELVVEMREQVRLWFEKLLFMSVVMDGRAPYRNVFVYEKVHDEWGRPMHKSWGNAIWFDEAVEKMGADVMRWMYVNHNQKANLNFGYGPAKEVTRILNILYNTGTYAKQSISQKPRKITPKEIEDKWILSRLNSTIRKTTKALEKFDPQTSVQEIGEFFINDLSRGYLQITRERIEDKEVQDIFYVCLLGTLKVLAPILPFLTEHIYQETYREKEGEESIHLLDWPSHKDNEIDSELEINMEKARGIVQAALAAREKAQLGLRWPVQGIILVTEDREIIKAAELLSGLIKSQANVKELNIQPDMPDVTYDIKADSRQIGSDFGNKTPKIIAKIQETSPDSIREHLTKEKKWAIKIDGEEISVVSEHLIITRQAPEHLVEEDYGNSTIYLDKTRTPELDAEGYAREIVRRVQSLRKQAGLEKKDRILLRIDAGELEDMISSHKNYVQEKVGADALELGKVSGKYVKEENIKGKKVSMGFDAVK